MITKSWILVPILAVAALATTGCKSKASTDGLTCGPGPADASCHYEGGCIDYVCADIEDGVCYTPDKHKYLDQRGCEDVRKGRYVTKCPCTHDKALGGCRRTDEGHVETTWTYAGMNRDEFEHMCTMSTQNTFITP